MTAALSSVVPFPYRPAAAGQAARERRDLALIDRTLGDLAFVAGAVADGDTVMSRLLGFDFGFGKDRSVARLERLGEAVPTRGLVPPARDPACVTLGRALGECLDAQGFGPLAALRGLGVPEAAARLVADGRASERAPAVGAFVLGAFEGASNRLYAQALEAAAAEGYLAEEGAYLALLAMRLSVKVAEAGRGGRVATLVLPGFGRTAL